MTDAERIAWLSENPIQSRWDLHGARRVWTVWWFGGGGSGPTFLAALDDAIGRDAPCRRGEQSRP